MQKRILITGSTDGIGLDAAEMLLAEGHTILLHGRNPAKLEKVVQRLSAAGGDGNIDQYVADLSSLAAVEKLAEAIAKNNSSLDVIINNAGVYKPPGTKTVDGLGVVFAVNTIAPYLLTKRLLHLIPSSGRVVNLSSAAQAPVDLDALAGKKIISEPFSAYAQSKLALTMWSRHLGLERSGHGPVIVAINPGSMLGTKMVQQGFGVAGKDIRIGGDILARAARSDEFADANSLYFDNDAGRFASPHPDALDPEKTAMVVQVLEAVLAEKIK